MKNKLSVVQVLMMGFSPSWPSVLLLVVFGLSLSNEVFASFRRPSVGGQPGTASSVRQAEGSSQPSHPTDGLQRFGSTVGRQFDAGEGFGASRSSEATQRPHDPYARDFFERVEQQAEVLDSGQPYSWLSQAPAAATPVAPARPAGQSTHASFQPRPQDPLPSWAAGHTGPRLTGDAWVRQNASGQAAPRSLSDASRRLSELSESPLLRDEGVLPERLSDIELLRENATPPKALRALADNASVIEKKRHHRSPMEQRVFLVLKSLIKPVWGKSKFFKKHFESENDMAQELAPVVAQIAISDKTGQQALVRGAQQELVNREIQFLEPSQKRRFNSFRLKRSSSDGGSSFMRDALLIDIITGGALVKGLQEFAGLLRSGVKALGSVIAELGDV